MRQVLKGWALFPLLSPSKWSGNGAAGMAAADHAVSCCVLAIFGSGLPLAAVVITVLLSWKKICILTLFWPAAAMQHKAAPVCVRPVGLCSAAARFRAVRSPHVAPIRALPEQLNRLAERWLQQDSDTATQEEIRRLISLEEVGQLEDRLGQRLQFGV